MTGENFDLDSKTFLSDIDIYKKIGKLIPNWSSLLLLAIFILFWLGLFDIFAHRITNKWSQFFSYFEGYRHPASVVPFLPFSAKVIEEDKAPYKIVFTGDSTSGGLLYHHSQAIPAYLNSALNLRGLNSHTYNMAFSGAHLSEQYFLMKEIIDSTDTIIFPIHYSFFSPRGNDGTFISHPEMVSFLTKLDYGDVEPLGLKPKTMVQREADGIINHIWYFYSVHRLIPYIIFGKPLKFWTADRVKSSLNFQEHSSVQIVDPNLPFFAQTESTQNLILSQNEILWENVQEIGSDNVNLKYLDKIGRLKNSSHKRMIAYFVPVNTKLLIEKGILKEKAYNQIIENAKRTLDKYSIEYIDFNDFKLSGLQLDDFYNPDHLLPQGNKKIAKKLADQILKDR